MFVHPLDGSCVEDEDMYVKNMDLDSMRTTICSSREYHHLVLLTLPLLWTRLAALVLVLALTSDFSPSLLNVFSVGWRF
ncbi:hypothetical protein F2Q69_00054242 [Brassica cretica]|uniref:Transmembrane protein n=2 Tax=Brassica cretica TaxID=69181 RepID=A0ABQ7EHV7_BRACR|nr:hypothetical protein F2Q69_00054242 [Brassica cretica]KAF3596584.1 hypothetical protein DY000_02023428 [Brassica cretica]